MELRLIWPACLSFQKRKKMPSACVSIPFCPHNARTCLLIAPILSYPGAKAAMQAEAAVTLKSSAAAATVGKIAAGRPDIDVAAVNELEKIPALASFGPIFKSSRPVELTESETEYVVACVKHVFAEHVVFQVNQALRNPALDDFSLFHGFEM